MARLFTDDQHAYFLNVQKGMSANDIAEVMNKKYGLRVTPIQIKNYRRNHKITSGLTGHFEKGHTPHNKGKKYPGLIKSSTQFKKGNIPPNYKPVGTINYTTDGYPKIKVADPNEWVLMSRYVWEQHRGPVPEGYKVIFLDSDRTNWDISNLALITDKELLRMNQNHYISDDADSTLAGLGIVKISNRLRELENNE